MFRWVIEQQLARGKRPKIEGVLGQVPKSAVNSWIKEAKAQGIRSVICMLDERQLALYEALPMDLIRYFRSKGLKVVHINAPNMRRPPLSHQHLKEVWKAYQRLRKPVLVHCSAGIGRTRHAVSWIKKHTRY